jgi:hypothetical protein
LVKITCINFIPFYFNPLLKVEVRFYWCLSTKPWNLREAEVLFHPFITSALVELNDQLPVVPLAARFGGPVSRFE